MTKASDNAFPSLLITEGTEPSAPAAGKQRLYIDSTTHVLMLTNSSGTESAVGGGAPTTADYLVGTAQGGLSAEIVVGTTPGGELGGTWGTPTVDIVHAGATVWTDYTPALTAVSVNPTLGSSTLTGRYKLVDSKTLVFVINFVVTTGGAWNAGTGEWKFSLPSVTAGAFGRQHVSAHILDNTTTHFAAVGEIAASATVVWPIIVADASGSKVLANAVPVTWATGDQVDIQGIIELT
jgi:hypothetical protein